MAAEGGTDMCDTCKMAVGCAVGATGWNRIGDAALNTFILLMVMDRLTHEIRREPRWTVMLADDCIRYLSRDRRCGWRKVLRSGGSH